LRSQPDSLEAVRGLGVAAFRFGRLAESEALFRRGLTLRPKSPGLHTNLGEVLRLLERRNEALDHVRQALEGDPTLPEAWNTLGLIHHDQGHLNEAEAAYREAIRLRPRFAAAFINLGITLGALYRGAESVEAFRAALQIDPENALALTNLGKVLGQMGDPDLFDEAEALCRRAAELDPHLADAMTNLGGVLQLQGRLDGSLACFHRALALEPRRAAPSRSIGFLLQQRGQYDQAQGFFENAHLLRPDPARYHTDLGGLAIERERFDEAARHYRLALEHAAVPLEARIGLGHSLMELGRLDEAEACFREALEIDPSLPLVWAFLARLQAETGDLALSCQSARTALAIRPPPAQAYCRLAANLGGSLPDADVAAMEALLDQKYLHDGARATLYFGLATVRDERGLYGEAASSLRRANALRLKVREARGDRYHAGARSDFVDRLIASFSGEFLRPRRGWGDPDQRPVFVVGLPRSGTTLVEQILASHPQVHGAGELLHVHEVFQELPALVGRPSMDPFTALGALDRATARVAARSYFERLESSATLTATRVVDKLPANIDFLGLISMLWPGSRVIVCHRDYRDIAVSCWQTDFGAIRWANDPEDIAQFFADYRRLLEHWRETRPLEWLDIVYEDVVRDMEASARRMIGFLGLEWDPACLTFHHTRRVVRTASVAQVRKPIYSRSLGRWRRYQGHLRPLFRALERHGVAGGGRDGPGADPVPGLPDELGDAPDSDRVVEGGMPGGQAVARSGALQQALALHVQGHLEDAEPLYRDVLLRDPDSVAALQGLGVLAFHLGRADEAASLFARGLALRPRSASLHANLASVLRVLKRLDEAADHVHTALERDACSPEAWNTKGLVAHDQRRYQDAEAAYHRAIRLRPSFAAAHLNLGITRAALRRWGDAEDALRTALEIDPGNPLGMTSLGRVLSEIGDPDLLDEAESLCREAVRRQPRLTVAHINLGITLHARRRRTEAADALRMALEIDPDNPLALTRLGRILGEAGDVDLLDEAEALCRRALALAPHLAEAFDHLGDVLRFEGRLNEAMEQYDRAIELEPSWAGPLWHVGLLFQETGRYEQAAQFYKVAQSLDGDIGRYHAHFGRLSMARDQHEEAIRHYELSLSYDPDNPETFVALGRAVMAAGRHDDADARFREASRIDPMATEPWASLSRLQAERGEFDLACEMARTALALQPRLGPAYCQLACILKDRLPDADLEALRGLLDHKYVPEGGRASLRFALAEVMEARGQYEEAAALVEAANALRSRVRAAMGQAYDPDSHSRTVDGFIAAFTPDYLVPRRGWGPLDPRPVFVVGLPRSGTTLVEQILASHPGVYGAGELTDAFMVFESLPALTGQPDTDFFAALNDLDPATAKTAARRYLGRLESVAPPGTARVVDKMPENIILLGLIAVLWPGAKVIVCSRDYRDIAVSCWQTDFAMIGWAHDAEHIARRLADYRRILEHWERTRPLAWLEVRYEELVGDLEGQSRRMIQFLGLDWDPACLRFHTTRRVVCTASLTQVRRPLYSHSVGRWRTYKTLVPSLFQALERHGLADPTDP
jgi:tetratricopeptide (TPR) repeat protein